jgi:glycosyltransferase involved in cell wall biosynthesis
MKIALLSTHDLQGGAAISAYRLHQGLRNHGHDSIMFVQSKTSNDTSVRTDGNRWHRLLNQFRPGLDRLALYPTRVSGTYSTGLFRNRRAFAAVHEFSPDVVHLQWVNGGYFSLSDVAKLDLPIVWRLPDWWLLTAGCHLPYDCKGYQMNCAHCPLLGEAAAFDRSALLHRWKSAKLKGLRNIKFVAPSRALAADAGLSQTLAGADVRVIPNGLDLTVHKPLNQAFARRALNLMHEGKVVLFGAPNGRNDPNKGYALLLQALARVAANSLTQFTCVAFGSEVGVEQYGNVQVHSVGVIRDMQTMNLLYAAADVMVVPSYQESFGQTAIEAMACGTPVVAFKTSGLLDIVDSGMNGYLAEKFDVDDLAYGICSILEHPAPDQLAVQARSKVEREFDINTVTARYISLYKEVIADHDATSK